jgi:hypothetical protein
MKTVGGLRKSRFVGIAKTQLAAYLVGTAYNLLRMARLQPATDRCARREANERESGMNEHKTTATGVAAKVSPTNSVFNVRFARHSSTAC